MRNHLRNHNNGTKRLVSQIRAEKKKTVLAVSLVTVMAFMWIRVFFKKTPAAASAVAMEQTSPTSDSKPALNVSFIELPEVAGRHDVVTRNFFTSNNWKNFDGKKTNVVSIEEVNVAPGNGSEKAIRKVVEKIKLEAIVVGENAKAFINDKVLTAGNKLLISDGIERYECEVVLIEENAVVIRCGEAEVRLKLRQVIENKK